MKVAKGFSDAVFNFYPAVSKKLGDTQVSLRVGDAASSVIKVVFLQEAHYSLGSVQFIIVLPKFRHLVHVILRRREHGQADREALLPAYCST